MSDFYLQPQVTSYQLEKLYHWGMSSLRMFAPASTANLGPAFDCLGLALDLWNETEIAIGDETRIEIEGEGAEALPRDESHLVIRVARALYAHLDEAPPAGWQLRARNRVPLNSGLGSSAAATATGLLAANRLSGARLPLDELLTIGAAVEGHADNLAAALYGGLMLVNQNGEKLRAQRIDILPLSCVVVLPEVQISTQEARAALPRQVPLADAVANIGRSLALLEALREGDIAAMATAMQDRLHQLYRMPLIPGAQEALEAAQAAGGAAALSGAGPSLIAFVEAGREKAVSEALRAPFAERQISTRMYRLSSTARAAAISGD
jgi:homoserine kinase